MSTSSIPSTTGASPPPGLLDPDGGADAAASDAPDGGPGEGGAPGDAASAPSSASAAMLTLVQDGQAAVDATGLPGESATGDADPAAPPGAPPGASRAAPSNATAAAHVPHAPGDAAPAGPAQGRATPLLALVQAPSRPGDHEIVFDMQGRQIGSRQAEAQPLPQPGRDVPPSQPENLQPRARPTLVSPGAATVPQALAQEPDGLRPSTSEPASGTGDAQAPAPADRTADPNSVLAQMTRVAPRHDIDNSATSPEQLQREEAQFRTDFTGWFSPWIKPRAGDEKAGRPHMLFWDDEEDEWEQAARLSARMHPHGRQVDEEDEDERDELEAQDPTQPDAPRVPVPDEGLYRHIVLALMKERLQLNVVPHVLNELRRQRLVILVSPNGRMEGAAMSANVDVLCPTRTGGSALRLAGTIERMAVQPERERAWLLAHVMKSPAAANAIEFHPLSELPQTTRLLVAVGSQAFAQSSSAHARIRLHDGGRLKRVLQPQWSLRIALAPLPIEARGEDVVFAESKGQHAS